MIEGPPPEPEGTLEEVIARYARARAHSNLSSITLNVNS